MAKQEIDIGVEGNDGTGDSIRESFRKVNENFGEVYAIFGLGGQISFTNLDDTPNTTVGNEGKVVLVKTDGTGLDFFDLVSNAGTNDAGDLDNTIAFSIDGDKLVVRAINTKLELDPAPRVENPLNIGAAAAYNTTTQNILLNDGTRSALVDAWNATHGTPVITEDNLIISKGFADSKYINTVGDTMTGHLNTVAGATGTQVPQIQEVVQKDGDTMTGALTLFDHPAPFAGAGTPNSQFDLQAATKYYVDSSSFSSKVNLYVRTDGDDFQRTADPGKEGRSEAYAYKTIAVATERAKLLQEASIPDIGPYVQPLQYVDGLDVYQSYVRNPATYGYNTASDQGTATTTITSVTDVVITNTVDYIKLEYPDFVFDEQIFRDDLRTVLDSVRIDISASTSSIKDNTLTRFIGLRLLIDPNSQQGIALPGQDTQRNAAIAYAKSVVLSSLVSASLTTGNPWYIATSNLFDIILDIFAGNYSNIHRVEGANYYNLYLHSGPDKFTIQSGNPSVDVPNRDIFPGKIVRGAITGAVGQIISYERGSETSGNPDYDTLEVQLLTPFEFQEEELIEYGAYVRRDQLTIHIESGIYEEQLPMRVPDNISIKGDEQRRVIIRPAPGTSASPHANTWFYRDAEIDGLTTSTAGEGYYNQDDSSLIGYFGYHYLKDPNLPLNISSFGASNPGNFRDATRLLQLNKTFIIEEIIAWVNATYPVLTYDEAIYRRDTRLIVEGMINDLTAGNRYASIRNQGAYYGVAVEQERQAAIDHINDIVQKVLINDAGDLYTPSLSSETQVVDGNLSAETGSTTQAAELVQLVLYAFEDGFNPAKNNDEMDMFLVNDATILRNHTAQKHGGFHMVLDPEGQIRTRSPYVQTASIFSKSINGRIFAGGQYVDGYTGNMPVTITSKTNAYKLQIEAPATSGLGIRKPQTPSSFVLIGKRYQVNAVRDYEVIGDTAYATLILDEGSNNGLGFDDDINSPGGPTPIVLQTAGYRSMLSNDYTQINDLGYGIVGNNNALLEAVSVFTYYAHCGYYSRNGSQIRSLTGNNSYGNFGLVSEGSDPDEVARIATLAQNLVQPGKIYAVDTEIVFTGDVTSLVSSGEQITQDGDNPTSGFVAFTNYDSGAGTTTVHVEKVIGAFQDGYDVYESGSTTVGIPSAIVKRNFTANENNVALFLYDLTDYPLNASEVEILHNTGLYQPYEVVSVTDTGIEIPLTLDATLCDSSNSEIRRKIWRMDLSSGVATADTGIQEQTDFGTLAVFRAKQNFLFNGIGSDIFTRPSTALIFNEFSTFTYRTLAFENTIVSGIPTVGQQATTTVDDNFNYIDISVDNDKSLFAVGVGYTIDSTIGAVPAGGTTLGNTQGDLNVAMAKLSIINQSRIIGMLFTWAGGVFRITGYTEATVTATSTPFAIITFEDVYSIHPTYVGGGLSTRASSAIGANIALKAGLESGEVANITVNISTTRATSHDFLDIGTGGYNDTNYPDRIFGAPVNRPVEGEDALDQNGFNTRAQVQERSRGRCFFASTDQDGFFRVGRFFTVDQGTGRVTFNAALVLTNIDGIGFKRGVRVNEFSADATFTNAASDAVATESATESYINFRLGWDREGDAIDIADLIGGGAVRKAGDTMTGNLSMGGNQITNLASPTSGSDAANKSYVDAEVAKYDTLAELNDTTISGLANADILIYSTSTSRWVNESFSTNAATSDISITYTAGVLSAQINPGAVINADVSASAAISQSKLAMQAATTSATAPLSPDQSVLGLARFDSANFTATNGWINITNGTITNAQLAGSIANNKLVNSSITVASGASNTAVSLGGTITFTGTANQVTVSESGGTITFSLPATINANTTGNADTATRATASNTVAIATRNTNASSHFLTFTTSSSGDLSLFTDSTLTYVPSTNTLTITNLTVGAISMTGALLPGANAPTDSGQDIGSSTRKWNTVWATTFNGVSTAATYADLAENYLGDADYEPGTVLVFGGNAEVTDCKAKCDRRVAGVVTTNPAHLMNSALEGEYVIGVALTGRVPCKVLGKVAKGDLLVTSAVAGYAIVDNDPRVGAVIGKAVGTKTDDGYGIVEVVVGRH